MKFLKYFLLICLFFFTLSSPCKSANSQGFEKNLEKVIKACNQFAFDLYKSLKNKRKNVLISPYSIDIALAMTFEGAYNETKKEIKKVLHIPFNEIKVYYLKLIKSTNISKKDCILKTANGMWVQQGFKVLSSYKNTIKTYYLAEIKSTDFKHDPEGSRRKINKWVYKKTEKKIKEVIPKRGINKLTRLVLVNAIYFKGKWLKKFNKKLTHEEPFYVSANKTIKVKMMQKKGIFNYAEDEKFQVLELPYKGKEISMIIFLPKKVDSKLDLTLSEFYSLISKLKKTDLMVFIPKFKLKEGYNLKPVLYEMGIKKAFTYEADFSRIDGKKDLLIQNVFHKAFVSVDEEGTEAAASTAVVIGLKAIPRFKVFKVNHPFLFFIVDKKADFLILFLGKVKVLRL